MKSDLEYFAMTRRDVWRGRDFFTDPIERLVCERINHSPVVMDYANAEQSRERLAELMGPRWGLSKVGSGLDREA